MHTSGQPDQYDPGWQTQPSPEEIYRWLGVGFAMLEVPRYRARVVGRSWETVGDQGDVRYAEVRLGHELDDDTTINVTTARDEASDTSLVDRLRGSLSNYQLQLVGRRETLPWGAGPPPVEYFERLEAHIPSEPTGTRTLSVNGNDTTSWLHLGCTDMVTGQPLAACGGRIGTSLVMVTGLEAAVTTAQLRMWPQPALLPGV